jgi:hypothetical protein
MKIEEFQTSFMPQLTARFPSVYEWLSRFRPEGGEDPIEPSRSSILHGWFKTIEHIPLSTALGVMNSITPTELEPFDFLISRIRQTAVNSPAYRR